MKRVALYCRVSSEEQAKHGYSIGAQIEALQEYAKEHNYQVIGEYLDEGISGRKSYTKRQALMRLLNDIEHDKVDIVLFCKLDRWFRSVQAYYQIQPILDAHNTAWQAIQEDYETITSSGRFKVNIMLSVAENEADRTAERIRFVQDAKRKKGEPLNDSVPLGYMYDAAGKQIVENPNTIQAARDIFQTYIDTRSARAARDMLFEKYGIIRTYVAIRTMLHNKFYIQLIGREQFQKTQELLQSRSQRNTKTGSVFLFTSIMYCKECGGRIKASRVKGEAYYSCYKHSEFGNSVCTNTKHPPEKRIETFCLTHVENAIREYNIEIRKKHKPPKDKSKIRRKMEKLKDLYLDDLISKDIYERDYHTLEKELYAVEIAPEPLRIEDVHDALVKYRELSKSSQKAFWSRIIKRIELDRDGNLFLVV